MNVHILGRFPKVSETFILDFVKNTKKSACEKNVFLASKGISVSLNDRELIKDIIGYNLNTLGIIKFLLAFTFNLIRYHVKFFNVLRGTKSNSDIFVVNTLLKLKDIDIDMDCYICHFATLAPVLIKLIDTGLLPRKPVFIFFRGYELNSKSGLNEYDLLSLNRKDVYLLPVSQTLKSILLARFPIDKIKLIHSGLDSTRYDFFNRESCMPSNGTIKFVQVGRIVEKKGLLRQLDLLYLLSQQKSNLNWEFSVIGSGPLLDTAKTKAEQMGISERINFLGAVDNKEAIKIIRNSDILLSPNLISKNGDLEGIPNVIKEAMLLGTITLCSDFSGNKEVITDKINGFLFDLSSDKDFIDKVSYIISMKREKIKNIRTRARSDIYLSFDVKSTSKDLFEFIEEVLDV